jgi:hypothetical protein
MEGGRGGERKVDEEEFSRKMRGLQYLGMFGQQSVEADMIASFQPDERVLSSEGGSCSYAQEYKFQCHFDVSRNYLCFLARRVDKVGATQDFRN